MRPQAWWQAPSRETQAVVRNWERQENILPGGHQKQHSPANSLSSGFSFFVLTSFVSPSSCYFWATSFFGCGVLVPPPLWVSQPPQLYRYSRQGPAGLDPQPEPPSRWSGALSVRTVHIAPTVWSKTLLEKNIVNITGRVWVILVDLDHWTGFSSHLRRCND